MSDLDDRFKCLDLDPIQKPIKTPIQIATSLNIMNQNPDKVNSKRLQIEGNINFIKYNITWLERKIKACIHSADICGYQSILTQFNEQLKQAQESFLAITIGSHV